MLAKNPTQAKTVLIVEDNELNMKLFNDLLEAHGYHVLQTRDGLSALEIARQHMPDLIIMDIQLPEVSGIEVTKWLKEDDELKKIPVIAVTAFAMKGDEEKIREGGCEAYISKPISVMSFLKTVDSFLKNAMTARVLVVDDILANVRLLEAKLSAEYFDVVTAMNGNDALESVKRTKPDIVLLDVMMPGIDGIEVCRQIKGDLQTHHIPVVMVTALDQPEDRVKGLEAGADDFLTKPVNDLALFCRVKSLVRLKMLTDELRARSPNGEAIRLVNRQDNGDAARPGKSLVIDNRAAASERTRTALVPYHEVTVVDDPLTAVMHAAETRYELIIINLDMDSVDGLRLCSQLKSLERTRQTPILIVVAPDDHQRLLRALDMGVNDYLIRPIDKQELLARANTQIRRCRYTDQLRSHVQATMELAVTDALTGLYNRRYMENQTAALVEHAINRGKSLSLLALDVDHFKSVNDENGHAVGDRVLQELASRLKSAIRNIDMICRIGGEEFVIVLPNTNAETAARIADRMRRNISGKPFNVGAKNGPLTITVSIGVAAVEGSSDTMEAVLKRADEALYSAKRNGRNRVNSTAA